MVGAASWKRVRPAIGRSRQRRAGVRRACAISAARRASRSARTPREAQHEGGVDDVLAGGAPVQPMRRPRAPSCSRKRGDQRRHRHAGRGGAGGQGRGVEREARRGRASIAAAARAGITPRPPSTRARARSTRDHGARPRPRRRRAPRPRRRRRAAGDSGRVERADDHAGGREAEDRARLGRRRHRALVLRRRARPTRRDQRGVGRRQRVAVEADVVLEPGAGVAAEREHHSLSMIWFWPMPAPHQSASGASRFRVST